MADFLNNFNLHAMYAMHVQQGKPNSPQIKQNPDISPHAMYAFHIEKDKPDTSEFKPYFKQDPDISIHAMYAFHIENKPGTEFKPDFKQDPDINIHAMYAFHIEEGRDFGKEKPINIDDIPKQPNILEKIKDFIERSKEKNTINKFGQEYINDCNKRVEELGLTYGNTDGKLTASEWSEHQRELNNSVFKNANPEQRQMAENLTNILTSIMEKYSGKDGTLNGVGYAEAINSQEWKDTMEQWCSLGDMQ